MTLFDRKVELIVGGNRFVYPDFDIYFQITYDTDSEPDTGEIIIFNLSDQTTKEIKKGQPVILNAGYGDDVGTIFAGTINKVDGGWDQVDRLLTLQVGDSTEAWMTTTVNKAYKPGIKSSQVIKDILKEFGLEIGTFKLAKDVTYPNGRSISGSIESVLRQIVTQDCSSRFYVQGGAVIIHPPGEGNRIAFVLNADTGLIETPQRTEKEDESGKGEAAEGYNVYSLLNHRIRASSVVKIESRTASGFYRVEKAIFIGNEMDFYTQMEVYDV